MTHAEGTLTNVFQENWESEGGLSLRSAVPGRERWEIDLLRDNQELAAALTETLMGEKGVKTVSANALTGRILVTYDPDAVPSGNVGAWLRAALSAALADPEIGPALREAQEAKTAEASTPSAVKVTPVAILTKAVAFVGGAWIVPALVGGGAGLTVSGLTGAAIGTGIAAVLTAVIAWGRRRWRSMVGTADATAVTASGMTTFAEDSPLRRLLEFARPYRRQVILASTCSVINKLMDLAPPFLIGLAVNIVAAGGTPVLAAIGIASPAVQLVVLGAVTAAIWIFESVFEYAFESLWRNLAQSIQNDLRLKAYAHVQRIELSYLEDESSGGLTSILNDDVNQLELFVNEGANNIIQVVTNLVVVGGIFVILAPTVAWITVLPIPVIVWGSFYYQRKIGPVYARVRAEAARLSGQLVNNLGGMTTIASYTAEDHEVERLRGLSAAYIASQQEAIKLTAAFTPMIRMAVLVGFLGTLVAGGMLALAGGISPGVYTVIVYLTQRFLWPLTTLGHTVELYERSMNAVTRVLDLLEAPLGPQGGELHLETGKVRGELQLIGVDFAYKDRTRVLNDFDLEIPAGKTTAIVGATGSGKTTILKLLLRFYEVQGGRILLDGHNIRELDLDDLRNAIGLVGQDGFLFRGTVRENIAYGRRDAPFDDIVEAARLAEADSFIRQLPEQYETMIGERGQKLSGGQRQRLCIARAILKNPPVLILDEATSSVDNETEAAIQRSLERISVGRTMVVIAHRLSTVRNADQIHVLNKDGSIVEQGRHEELLSKDGLYSALWKVQSGTAVVHHVAPDAVDDAARKKSKRAKKSETAPV